MKRALVIMVLAFVLLMGCKTLDPTVEQKVVAPDLSFFRIDVFEMFPLIAEPQTDADLMYNSLVIEMDGSLTGAYADMLEEYNRELAKILAQ